MLYLQIIRSRLVPGMPYILLGYSFGTLPMLKLAGILENEGSFHTFRYFVLFFFLQVFLYIIGTSKFFVICFCI